MTMDYLTLMLLTFFLVATIRFYIFIFSIKNSKSPNKLPPGPYPYPIIGSFLKLGTQPHESLTKLSETYGPVMTVKLGNTTTIVMSSPQAAREVLQKHDHTFSYRSVPDAIRAYGHNDHSVVWLPPLTQWRVLKRICVTKVFSSQQLDSTQTLRQRKVQELLDHLDESSKKGEALDIREATFTTVLNAVSNTLFSMDVAHYASDKAHDFKDLIWGIMEEGGKPNVVDFFPTLRLLDPQGSRKRMESYFVQLIRFFDDLLEDRLHSRSSEIERKDVLDTLIQVMTEESQVTRRHVLHLFLDLFVAGIDTTSSTLEWAMTELLRNPEKLAKAREELKQILHQGELPNESHISKLPFLRAIVKETMRLHPPIPLIVRMPPKSEEDSELCGFLIPKSSRILINVWAIGRDSRVWGNPNLFMPERFMQNEIDFKGHHFELTPFGAGRRICPGLPLAHRTVHIILASLLHCYDWKLPDGLRAEDMDMSEKYGLSLHKAIPLQAIPIKA